MAPGTVTTCGGTFYDNGGFAGSYTSNCNITETFTSSTGNCLTFVFTTFNTQTGNDILTVYDGPNTSSPVIGNFSGLTVPGTITSSTGSLTFKFISNAAGNKIGWAATISCGSCGNTYLMNNNSMTNTCDGLFYDSGGASGNYGNNQNYTQTYCSSAGNCINFSFYSFKLLVSDSLKIYDGPTTASPLIASYTNTAVVPPAIYSSTGCITFKMKTNASGVSTGWAAAISCSPCPTPPAAVANYTQPTVGLGGSYVGGPMIATCGGTYADNGGISGNYANNVTLQVYQTFCPAAVNTCLRAQFYSVDLKSGDVLQVLNGPTMGCAPFPAPSSLSNTNCTSYQSCMAKGYGPYLSNDQSGCITFIFNSNGAPNATGWVATLDCIPCASGPTGIDNNDCSDLTPVCSNIGFTDASTGPGVVADVHDNCLVTETYSNWYSIKMAANGVLAMTIDPTSTGSTQPDDYDWALFGPNVSCSTLGNPIRCSTATTQGQTNTTGNMGNTGISTTNNQIWPGYSCGSNNDISETSCGNGWVNDLPVTAGQTYYLCISKWSAGGQGFNLTWNMSGGASIDCSVLPIELTDFTCQPEGNVIKLNWTSASEINNAYYLLQHSSDGEHFETLATVPGKMFSSLPTQYFTLDSHPYAGHNYYQLSQFDVDGHQEILRTIACEIGDPYENVQLHVYDLSGRLLQSATIVGSDFASFMHSLPLQSGVYVTTMIHKNGKADVSKFLKTDQ
jgi:hypothetical protein